MLLPLPISQADQCPDLQLSDKPSSSCKTACLHDLDQGLDPRLHCQQGLSLAHMGVERLVKVSLLASMSNSHMKLLCCEVALTSPVVPGQALLEPVPPQSRKEVSMLAKLADIVAYILHPYIMRSSADLMWAAA